MEKRLPPRLQFIIYEDDTAAVSMLFDDANESFRHIIDYAPLPLLAA